MFLPLPLLPAALLGERLTQLRTVLAAHDPLYPQMWLRPAVARAAGLSPAALARLEKTGTGTAISLATVLAYYQELGVNLAWVLVPDNAAVPFFAFRDVFQDEKVREVGYALEALGQRLQLAAAGGEGSTPGGVGPFLEQVQQAVHGARVNLLPPLRLVESAADLRAYQRRLPPVLATSAGWRSCGLVTIPYHYYEAGESVPRCGTEAEYLTYEAGPRNPSDSIKCLFCRSLVGEAPAHFAQSRPRNALLR